jgi:hypothetical protein
MAIVYKHIREDLNEVFYIGMGENESRAYTEYKRSVAWKNITNKTTYRVEIIFNNLKWEEACEKEKEYIKFYGRRDLGLGPLVNMTDGGEGGLGKIISEKHKIAVSIAQKGRKRTYDSINKFKQKMIGRVLSEQHKKSIGNTLLGIKRDDNFKEKVKTARLINNGMKDKHHSEEVKKKMSKSHKLRHELNPKYSNEFINNLIIKINNGETPTKIMKEYSLPKTSFYRLIKKTNE